MMHILCENKVKQRLCHSPPDVFLSGMRLVTVPFLDLKSSFSSLSFFLTFLANGIILCVLYK